MRKRIDDFSQSQVICPPPWPWRWTCLESRRKCGWTEVAPG
jgi:hypothetical protein